MARTNINFQNNKQKLAMEIWQIFQKKGYEHTTLAFILESLKLNKGTFYHYFSSKEECLDFAIKKFMEDGVRELQSKDEKNKPAEIRLTKMMAFANAKAIKTINDDQYQYQNADVVLRQKLIINNVLYFAPLFSEIIQVGNDEGAFNVDNPLEVAEMLILLSNTYLNTNFFNWDSNQIELKYKAYENIFRKLVS